MLLSLAGVTGCRLFSRQPKTVDEARTVAAAARDEAQAALEARATKKAVRAADRAERAARAVQCAPGPKAPQDGPCGEVARLAYETRELAEEAREWERLGKVTSSLKAKAYRLARRTAITTGFRTLAAAAERADGHRVPSLPESVREPALAACTLADAKQPDGECDWAKAARTMRAVPEGSPLAAFILSMSFVVAQRPELALIEVEELDAACPDGVPGIPITPRDCQSVIAALRSIVLSENDLPRLARREVPKLPAEWSVSDRMDDAELGSWLHLGIAASHLSHGRFQWADEELARAIRFSPRGSLTVFVTGERPVAGGGFERVPDSLEALARTRNSAEAAAVLAKRTRCVRDGQAAEPVVLDKRFIAELILVCLQAEARRTPTAARIEQMIEASRELARPILDKIPMAPVES